jgi:hypothetical protein
MHGAAAIPFSLARSMACAPGAVTIRQDDHHKLFVSLLLLPIRMQPSRTRLVILALLLLPFIAAQGGDAQNAVTFPAVSSYNLNKVKISLPADLAGQVNLLLVSFQPEQQKDIDSWTPAAQGLLHTTLGFRWYRLPVSGPENMIFRWWENSSMRSDETDPEIWPWIIPLYVNKDEFRRTLQISGEKEVVVLLTDKQGHVLWRASGAMTPANRTALEAAVAAAKASHQ